MGIGVAKVPPINPASIESFKPMFMGMFLVMCVVMCLVVSLAHGCRLNVAQNQQSRQRPDRVTCARPIIKTAIRSFDLS